MASMIFNQGLRAIYTGAIDLDTDTFYATLHTDAMAPNKDTWDFADDLTNEVVGTGYTAGGKVIPCVVAAVDTINDDVEATFGPVQWDAATITARYLVVRKYRGGLASADELVYAKDFGSNVSSTADTFLSNADIVRFSNPG